VRVVHQRGHPLRELRELLVEGLDLVGAEPQHGIGVLADLREREPAAGLVLGRAPAVLVGDLSLDLAHPGRQSSRLSPCNSVLQSLSKPFRGAARSDLATQCC